MVFYKGRVYHILYTQNWLKNCEVCETRVYMDAFSNVVLSLMNSMSQIPGIMSKMPPLPVSVDERLASYVLPRAPMVNFFCSAY